MRIQPAGPPPVVYPVPISRGARLFEVAAMVPKLRLSECRPFRSGIVLMSYGTKTAG